MKFFISLCLLCGLTFLARADLTEVDIDNAYFTGKVFTFSMPNPTSVTSGEGGAGLNLIPVSYVLTRKSNLEQTAGYGTAVSIRQTKIYIPATNQFLPITPRTITAFPKSVSKVANSDNGTNAEEPVAGAIFFRTFNSAPYNTDEYRFGKYQFVIQLGINGTNFQDIFSIDFIISPIGLRDANVEGGTNPGGGISPGDLNDQPVNQTGFWEGIFQTLFIPNEETLNTFRDTLALWGTWGPFGIINYISGQMSARSQEQQMDYKFSVFIPYAGVTEFDLSPYETFIKIARVLMAMTIWVYVVMGLWKKVYQKV